MYLLWESTTPHQNDRQKSGSIPSEPLSTIAQKMHLVWGSEDGLGRPIAGGFSAHPTSVTRATSRTASSGCTYGAIGCGCSGGNFIRSTRCGVEGSGGNLSCSSRIGRDRRLHNGSDLGVTCPSRNGCADRSTHLSGR